MLSASPRLAAISTRYTNHSQSALIAVDFLELQIGIMSRDMGLVPFVEEDRGGPEATLHFLGNGPHHLALPAGKRECDQELYRKWAYGHWMKLVESVGPLEMKARLTFRPGCPIVYISEFLA